MSGVPFVDLGAEHESLRGELEAALGRVLRSSAFILGPEVLRFERLAAEYLGVPHAVGVSSGTDALLVALLALELRPGDRVITTPFSFFATVESICRAGGTPRFVDLEPETLELDPAGLAAALAEGARAVVPVHLYGRCGGIARLVELAGRHGVPVIEDAAQAFGSRLSGRAAGTWGRAGAFSFFPSKVLGALGDGGLAVTADAELAARCRALRQHGLTSGGHVTLGGNFRLDGVQAAALAVKLPHVPDRIERRRRLAARYDELLAGMPEVRTLPDPGDWNGAIYTIRVPAGRRDALRSHLSGLGIETRVYYPTPLHLEPALGSRSREHLPVAEQLAREVLSLPLHPWLSGEQASQVAGAVTAFLARPA